MIPSKNDIRVEMRRRLQRYDVADRQRAGARIASACERLMSGHLKPRSILCYVSRQDEAPTHDLIRSCIRRGIRTCVPCSDPGSKTLRASELGNFSADLEPGIAGILEPRPSVRLPVASEEIDLFLTPGMAFDLQGWRVGRGGGYFDKYLSGCRENQIKVGLAFSWQIVENIAAEAHDVRMDLVVTDECVIQMRDGLLES